MSQRLHVGKTEKNHYDCVIASTEGAREKLLSDWLCFSNGYFLSPWKIAIKDDRLWLEIESIVKEVITEVNRKYPDDVTSIYRWNQETKKYVREH